MIDIHQTEEYAKWFNGLRDRTAKARINARIRRVSLGNFGDVKPVGKSVRELRIPYGPGYRVYFSKQGNAIVLLLCGGDKGTQRRDIELAHKLSEEL